MPERSWFSFESVRLLLREIQMHELINNCSVSLKRTCKTPWASTLMQGICSLVCEQITLQIIWIQLAIQKLCSFCCSYFCFVSGSTIIHRQEDYVCCWGTLCQRSRKRLSVPHADNSTLHNVDINSLIWARNADWTNKHNRTQCCSVLCLLCDNKCFK